jgi:hypothetical protein
VTNRSAYHSDEELIKRLQAALRTTDTEGTDLAREDENVSEARTLAAELAERIYADPASWGIGSIPDDVRDEAVADAFVAMLFAVTDLGGRQSVTDWFSITVESRFRRLWKLTERATEERQRRADEAPSPVADEAPADEPEAPPTLFEEKDGVWGKFEHDFPRDAFALRLRYLLKRTPDEMTIMLDAPSARAIGMRLDRARDRFRMFCEQSGMTRRQTTEKMGVLIEERST